MNTYHSEKHHLENMMGAITLIFGGIMCSLMVGAAVIDIVIATLN